MPSDSSADTLRKALIAIKELRARLAEHERPAPIAIIGMGCRFPGGADDAGAYWSLLAEGRLAVREVPADRWVDLPDRHPLSGAPLLRMGGYLDDVAGFDPAFFEISHREAAAMDPQHRLALEVAYQALEHAGVPSQTLRGSDTGVFVGCCNQEYTHLTLDTYPEMDPYSTTGVAASMTANRVSYAFDLRGPSMTVDTACSSSLVALDLAVQSLGRGDCTVALAGGVNLVLSKKALLLASEWAEIAKDGKCRAFDRDASGFVRGEGAGFVVLKRLADAEAAGDRIWAVIRATAVNQDGRSAGITAPNGQSQVALVQAALRRAGIGAADLGYVEAHGTATALGDPIEMEALCEVLKDRTRDGRPHYVGSAKTNLGHLEGAAGMAGVIKTTLALAHGAIPAHLHFRELSPNIDLGGADIAIPTEHTPWPRSEHPRRAGVSAFGFGGTNGHVILEEAPAATVRSAAHDLTHLVDGKGPFLLAVSAQSEAALRRRSAAVADALAADPTADHAANLAYTLATRRDHHRHRLSVAGSDVADLIEQLRVAATGQKVKGLTQGRTSPRGTPKLAFVFGGTVAPHAKMIHGLYAHNGTFRKALDRAARAVDAHTDWVVLDELLAEVPGPRLLDPAAVHPLTFAVQFALAELWSSLGARPAMVLGHSIGEIGAACFAGALDLDDAARLVVHRARLLASLYGRGDGAMALLGMSSAEAREAIAVTAGHVWIAAENGPRITVIAGAPDAVAAILGAAEQAGTFVRRLIGDVAGHTPALDTIAAELVARVGPLRAHAGHLPMVSTLTGAIEAGESLGIEYFQRQLAAPVRFQKAIETALGEGAEGFLEIATTPTLGLPIHETMADARRRVNGGSADDRSPFVVASLRRDEDDREALLRCAGALYAHGVALDLATLTPPAELADLPTYPFERVRCWLDESEGSAAVTSGLVGPPLASSLDPSTLVFPIALGGRSRAYLRDHAVQGQPIVPGVAYIDIALAGARQAFGSATDRRVDDIRFERPLLLDGVAALDVQLAMHREAGDEGPSLRFTIASRRRESTETGAPFIIHARGRLSPDHDRDAGSDVDLAAIRARCTAPRDIDAYYRTMRRHGGDYGDAFRTLRTLSCGERIRDGDGGFEVEAIGEVVVEPAHHREGHVLHPSLLDGCLHVLGAAINDTDLTTAGVLYLPTGVGSVRVLRETGHMSVHSHGRLRVGPSGSGHDPVGEVSVYDAEGRLCVEVEGLRFKALEARAPAQKPQDWIYGLRHVVRPHRETDLPGDRGGSYLIVDGEGIDDGGLGGALAAELRRRGARVEVVSRNGEGHDCASWTARLDELDSRGEFARLTGVVHLASAATTPLTLDRANAHGAHDLLGLLQALADRAALDMGRASKLVVVTRGVIATEPAAGAGDLHPEQAPAAGIVRVAVHEHPELSPTHIDLPGRFTTGAAEEMAKREARWVADELGADDHEDQVALRSSGRLLPRLNRIGASASKTAARLTDRVRADGTYLITGGLGGVGLAIADGLTARGAGTLVLVSRRPPSEAVAARLDAMREKGTEVVVRNLDIGIAGEVAALFADLRSAARPLRGIVHSAATLDDGLLRDLDPSRFAGVFAPKVHAALHLAEGVRNLASQADAPGLDFFVLCSSMASIFGSLGQANYVAANSFLDTLAPALRAEGIAATSINWGLWSIVGGENLPEQLARRAAAQGLVPMQPEDAIAAFDLACGDPEDGADGAFQRVVGAVDWRRAGAFAANVPVLSAMALDSALGGDEDATTGPALSSRLELLALEPSARVERLTTELGRHLSAIAGIPEGSLDLDLPLVQAGIDSMMAVELKNAIEHSLEISLPAVLLIKGPTPREVTAEILRQLEQGATAAAAATPSPTSGEIRLFPAAPTDCRPGESPLYAPVSYNQAAMWALHQLAPRSAGSNVAVWTELDGRSDLSALRASLAALVRRHASMRTTYGIRDGALMQCVHPDFAVPIVERDATAMREAEIKAAVRVELEAPFDLENGPLGRFTVLRRGPRRALLVVVMHHIGFDFWSGLVMMYELRLLYLAHRAGQVDREAEQRLLPPLATSYVDFVAYQRAKMAGPEGEALLSYWERVLADPPAPLSLPTDRPRPPKQSHASAFLSMQLSREEVALLKAFAAERGVTLYAVLLACFYVLLYRHSGQDDIVVGTPMSGRLHPELASLVGYVANPVALRMQASRGEAMESFVGRTAERVLEALEHQECPLPLILERLQYQRDPARSPLFQALFTLEHMHRVADDDLSFVMGGSGTEDLDGLDLGGFAMAQPAGQFDVFLAMAQVDDGLYGVLSYAEDLFDRETVATLLGHYKGLLMATVQAPATPIGRLPMMTKEERAHVLALGRGPRVNRDPSWRLDGLIADQAARTPDASAVIAEAGTLSYGELVRRARSLSVILRAHGVNDGVTVGIHLERGLDLSVGLLGILFAGGAFVPLDTDYPVERLLAIAEDADVALILSHGSLGAAGRFSERKVVEMDGLDLTDGAALEPVAAGGDAIAYVLFTSGSTGRPKGAANAHAAIVNRLLWAQGEYHVGADDAFLHKTPIGFDVSVWELFWPLITGARLVMARPGGHRDPSYLTRAVREHGITTIHFVPTMLDPFVEDVGFTECSSLARIICSGEALPHPTLSRALDLGPNLRVDNAYGPTEAAIDVSFWRGHRADTEVPIGRPIDNVDLHVLGPYGEVLPIGVSGELHIGGVALARGYVGDPQKTAERFVASDLSDGRLYRTGDRVKLRRDGNLIYQGRLDAQVKIRGVRIELGEVAAAIRNHPDIEACAATLYPGSGTAVDEGARGHSGHGRLVAYVVPRDGAAVDPQALRDLARRSLPEQGVPSYFVVLPELPTTKNGKLDRRALPAPDAEGAIALRAASGIAPQQRVAPRTEVERRLAAIWSELLGIDEIGVHDNFFALGGDSILGIRALSKAAAEGLEASAAELYERQTIAELAEVVRINSRPTGPSVPVTGTAPLSPIQAFWLDASTDRDADAAERLAQAPGHYNQAVGLQIARAMDRNALRKACAAVVAHHDALRIRLCVDDAGEIRQAIGAPADADFLFHGESVVDLDGRERQGALDRAWTDLQRGFDVREGPIFGVTALDHGPSGTSLLIAAHHVGIDGVSWSILIEDLLSAYEQAAAGGAPALPAKTASVLEWSQALNGTAVGDGAEAHAIAFRSGIVSGSRLAATVAANTAGTAVYTSAAAVHASRKLGSGATLALLGEAREAYRTDAVELLLAAVGPALEPHLEDGDNVIVAYEGHGRDDFEASPVVTRTVGWFTSLFPVLLPRGEAAGEARIVSTKRALREAGKAGQRYGALRQLGKTPTREIMASVPTAEVSFNYLGSLDGALAGIPGVSLLPAEPKLLHGPDVRRPFAIDLLAYVLGGELHWVVVADRDVIDAAALAEALVVATQAVVDHCRDPNAGRVAAEDFPDADLEQDELERILSRVG